MPTLDYLTGFNHRDAPSGVGGSSVGQVLSGTITADTTARHTGGSSLKIVGTGGTANWTRALPTTTSNKVAVVVYVNFSSIPTNDCELAYINSNTSNALVGLGVSATAGGLFVPTKSTGGGTTTFGTAFGPTISTGVWYRLEWSVDASANPWSILCQVAVGDSTTVSTGSNSFALAADTFVNIELGNRISGATFTAFFTDLAVSVTAGDYPIGPVQVNGYWPNAVGTHNLDASTSVYFFKEVSAVDSALTTAETTSYTTIDDQPLDQDVDCVFIQPSSVSGQSASGATTAAAGPTGTWTNITNAQGAPTNAVGAAATTTGCATAAPAKNGTAAADLTGWSGLSGTVTALTVNVRAAVSATGVTGETIQIDLYDGTTLVSSGTAQTLNQTAFKDWSQSFSSVSVSASTMKIRVTFARGNTNSTYTADLDAVALASVTTQSFPTTAQYVEYQIADEGTLSTAPIGVVALLRGLSDSSTNATMGTIVKLFDSVQGTNQEDVVNSTLASGVGFVAKTFTQRPNSGGAWTLAAFNGLRARFGFTTDVTNHPRLQGFMVEAAFAPAAAPSIKAILPVAVEQAVQRGATR